MATRTLVELEGFVTIEDVTLQVPCGSRARCVFVDSAVLDLAPVRRYRMETRDLNPPTVLRSWLVSGAPDLLATQYSGPFNGGVRTFQSPAWVIDAWDE